MSDQGYLKGSCQHCGNHIAFPFELSGTSVKCSHCAQETLLASESEVPQAGSLDQGAPLPPPRSISAQPSSFLYRLSVVLVAGMMVLMPLIYLATLLATAWGVRPIVAHISRACTPWSSW